MTAPDLTPEQRETLVRMGVTSSPILMALIADARAEGDRQGAARVAAAVQAVLSRVDGGHALKANLRAALAEAQEGDQ